MLGEETINFVGYAYGGMFPAHLDRSVLVRAPGLNLAHQQCLWRGDALQRKVDHWARWTGEAGRTSLRT